MVEVRRRASEAKGPFPGGKRVGSWGKKKRKRKKKVDPPSAVGGLEGNEKRVGSWGKSKRKNSIGRAPADLHPPLNKNRWD